MKLLHRMVLRMLPGPFLGALGVLMFLLLMQFLMRYLPDLVGKGLSVWIIIELVAYNLTYMLVLAVPMSVLIANLLAYGKLSEAHAYTVARNAGISLPHMMWPSMVAGLILMFGMGYFNSVMLPEANYRASGLWRDIRKKKPGFELQPGVYYNGLKGYSIQARDIPEGTGDLIDVTIFDFTSGNKIRTVISAKTGTLTHENTSLLLTLFTGEMHRYQPERGKNFPEEYELLQFEKYKLRFDLSELEFERSDSDANRRRSDRTMRSADMVAIVDSMENGIAGRRDKISAEIMKYGSIAHKDVILPNTISDTFAINTKTWYFAGLDHYQKVGLLDFALSNGRALRDEVDQQQNRQNYASERINRYLVEIHKKRSIAVACLIFALIGAPLGLSTKRGGMGKMAVVAVALFLGYWITLVQGEKLADRGFLDPWLGMWFANILTGIGGLWLTIHVAVAPATASPFRGIIDFVANVFDKFKKH